MSNDDIVVSNTEPGSSPPAASETIPPEEPITLEEHDETELFPLSKTDGEFIESLGEKSGPLSVTYTAEGTATISSSSYVGVVTLPSGVTIEVTPKETVSRLLYLLQYAFDVPASTIEQTTELTESETFIDAFAALFHAELNEVLQQGIRRDYKRVTGLEEDVRGRLDVQRQIQRPTPIPTDFAVEYDAFTSDTVLNRAVHQATRILSALVDDQHLAAKLSHQERRLRQYVSPRHVSVTELDSIEITRLTEYYADLVDLTRIVLTRRFFEDLTVGDHDSFGLFVNMNSIFEKVVERAFREAADAVASEWTVTGQADIGTIVTGPHAVDMTPDFVVNGSNESALLVGDAKWKTGRLSSSDVYQITSYMLAEGSPGMLVYPQQGGREKPSQVHQGDTELVLRSVELPTAAEANTYQEYRDELVTAAENHLTECIY